MLRRPSILSLTEKLPLKSKLVRLGNVGSSSAVSVKKILSQIK